jgi:hypothetical protein
MVGKRNPTMNPNEDKTNRICRQYSAEEKVRLLKLRKRSTEPHYPSLGFFAYASRACPIPTILTAA